MDTLALECWVYGGDSYSTFTVKIPRTETVGSLKKVIKDENSVSFSSVDARHLILYSIPMPDDEHFEATLKQWTFKGQTRLIERRTLSVLNLSGSLVIVHAPNLGAKRQTRHRSPSSDLEQRKRKKMVPETLQRNNSDDDGALIIARWRSKHLQAGLPTIDELAGFVDCPLSDDDKIPISANFFNGLVSSSLELHDICTPNDVQPLFRLGHGGTRLDKIFWVVASSPPYGGTERAFIHFWDDNIRGVVELLLPTGRSMRNSSEHTATMRCRPDYAFLVNNFCPFRGEERSPESTADPKQELADKLAWAYDPAPYVLGYYAIGPCFTLVAICPPLQGQSRPFVRDIVSVDLRLKVDRIKNICRLINLAGLFEPLANLVRPPDAEFVKLARENGTVEIAGHHVVKSYTCADKLVRVRRLQSIYRHLKKRQVPHVDSLKHHFDTSLILSPRGLAETPTSEEELLSATICVLEALEVLHEEPSILHRDIRWPNVMRRLEDRLKWFIVDWEDAVFAPGTAEPHFKQSTHSPCVFVEGHGTEVDIWGVGGLIIDCKALDISSQLKDLGRWMQGSSAPSAREALDKIKEYISSSSMHATLL